MGLLIQHRWSDVGSEFTVDNILGEGQKHSQLMCYWNRL
jgi:hypothetical protein